jgi:C4-dicarboxylate transporter DctM subunit
METQHRDDLPLVAADQDDPIGPTERNLQVLGPDSRVGHYAMWVLRVLFWIRVAALAVTVLFVLYEIYERYIANTSVAWSENLLGLLFTWIIFLSIPETIWREDSPRLELFNRIDRPRVQARLSDLGTGITAAYLIYIIASYLSGFSDQFDISLQPLGWPQAVETLPILVGAVLSLILLLVRYSHERMSRISLVVVAVVVVALLGFLFSSLPGVVVGLVLMVVLAALGTPIAIVLGLGAAGIVGIGGDLLSTGAGQLTTEPTNVALLALPLFMLMGGLVANTSLVRGLSRFVNALFGWLPGGSGVAAHVASGIFANMTGNAVADTATMGSIFIPQMIKSGDFEPEEAAAVQAAGGVIGVVFPPSIAMILFATVVTANITEVFRAVLIPALLLLVVMTVVTILIAMRRHQRRGKFSGRAAALSIPPAIPVLLIPVILDGGIFSGVFAPFESGAVAVAVVVIFLAVTRKIHSKQLLAGFDTAFKGMTIATFILVNVSLLNNALVVSGVSANIASIAVNNATSAIIVLLIINAIFLVLHTVFDAIASILIFVPLILPAVMAAHINPLQLAAVIAINSTIGLILPPLGIGLYVSSGIAGVKFTRVVRHIWPFVLSSLLVLLAVTFIPALSLWLG